VRDGAADGPATLMLRPEQLLATAVSDESHDRGNGKGIGTVLSSEFRGHDVLLVVDPGDGEPITVRQHSLDPPGVDAKVHLDVVGPAVVLDERSS
jgi:iron(III) transport system ATP-binding protein